MLRLYLFEYNMKLTIFYHFLLLELKSKIVPSCHLHDTIHSCLDMTVSNLPEYCRGHALIKRVPSLPGQDAAIQGRHSYTDHEGKKESGRDLQGGCPGFPQEKCICTLHCWGCHHRYGYKYMKEVVDDGNCFL